MDRASIAISIGAALGLLALTCGTTLAQSSAKKKKAPATPRVTSRPLPKGGLPPPPPSRRSANRATPLAAEDLRLGAFVAPPRSYPFPLLGDDRAREVFVDKAGELYKQRKYSGLVPDWRRRQGRFRRGRCQVTSQDLNWVGFQNHASSSRIFVQVAREACGYVYRPDDKHIVIDLPAVQIPNSNLKRDILTGAFPTPVDLIHVEEIAGRGTRITIVLKNNRRYLSSHLGRFVFVDIAR